ncbi:hypothetical protein WJX72_011203 [[Myrmecia] bisecta]|uniref:Uncharacterized protein n=1 Tax=[Myrmecia] bisecta TaxID=41462 RepID=A0AAW1PQD7_9CHLO
MELANKAIGASDIQPGKAGVSFRAATLEAGYRANLWLRSAIRVLVLLAEGPLNPRLPGGDEIYRFFRDAVDWSQLLTEEQTFHVEARVWSCSDIPSSNLVQIRARDAICDSLRDAKDFKPFPPEPGKCADLPLYAALLNDYVSLYRDMSGDSLHRRGYRSAMHKASLNESAAAGALTLAGWPELAASNPGAVLADPMCGSGTFLIEAALMATNTAPGLMRAQWPFQTWPDFDAALWQHSVAAASAARMIWDDGLLLGNDLHEGAVALARRDAVAAGVDDMIEFSSGSCASWRPREVPHVVITNPPWGQRLLPDELPDRASFNDRNPQGNSYERRQQAGGDSPNSRQQWGQLNSAWQDLSVFLKGQCPNASAYVLSGNKDITRQLFMKAERRIPLTLGGKDCRLLKYQVLPPKPEGLQMPERQTRQPRGFNEQGFPVRGRARAPAKAPGSDSMSRAPVGSPGWQSAPFAKPPPANSAVPASRAGSTGRAVRQSGLQDEQRVHGSPVQRQQSSPEQADFLWDEPSTPDEARPQTPDASTSEGRDQRVASADLAGTQGTGRKAGQNMAEEAAAIRKMLAPQDELRGSFPLHNFGGD